MISVVTISFNQIKYLRIAVESVIQQSYKDVQYIIVDPGSVDGSREYIMNVAKNDSRIVPLFEPDNGPADGLNKGFNCATGEIQCFLNSDDEFLPGAFNNIVEYFNEHKEVDLITGGGYHIDGNGVKIKKVKPNKLDAKKLVTGASVLFQQGTFFRKEIFELSKGFNVDNKTCWDAELFLEMLLKGGKHAVIKKDVACFRLHENSISGSDRLRVAYEVDRIRLFNKVFGRSWCYIDDLRFQWQRVARHIGYIF